MKRKQKGGFTLVLHGHMPWVMHHGRWPHGSSWIFEAALGVYLPLLGVIEELQREGVRPGFVLGLTPVLLEQLRCAAFREGFEAFMEERLQRARRDRAEPEFAHLAGWWEGELVAARDRFQAAGGDLVGAFAGHAQAGRIEILSSFATHGYAPLILHDRSIRGQLRTGLDCSERHLGFRPKGIWLPECGFRPAGPWTPPVLHGDVRVRRGVDRILEEEGVTHFFVDSHLVAGARSEGVVEEGGFRSVGWDEADRYPGRGWRSVMEPHRVQTEGSKMSEVVAFARHPELSEQVWSADAGYPGDPAYLEFHKKKDGDGHRYWRVTSRKAGLGEKAPYEPEVIAAVVYAQARHFAGTVRARLREHRAKTGRPGVVVAPFDAELFGHWWLEGPRFLREVCLALAHDPEVQVETAAEHLARVPPDKVAWLPEGSWGEGGDHRVWLNEATRWTWEAAYRAEDRFLGLLWDCDQQPPGPKGERAWALLHKAARELLLLQASDWQFVIHTGGAVDYGFRRLAGHLERFDQLGTAISDVVWGREPDPLLAMEEAFADAHDDCFPMPPLDAWR